MSRTDRIRTALGPWLGFRPWRRHSLVLMVSGLVAMGYGVSMLNWDLDGPRAEGLIVALNQAPIKFWAAVWIGAGVLSCLSSRWPQMSEKWGYSVLTGLSAGWSATYFAGAFVTDNDASDITGGLVWCLISVLWWAIAGLMNPDRVVVVEIEVPHEHH